MFALHKNLIGEFDDVCYELVDFGFQQDFLAENVVIKSDFTFVNKDVCICICIKRILAKMKATKFGWIIKSNIHMAYTFRTFWGFSRKLLLMLLISLHLRSFSHTDDYDNVWMIRIKKSIRCLTTKWFRKSHLWQRELKNYFPSMFLTLIQCSVTCAEHNRVPWYFFYFNKKKHSVGVSLFFYWDYRNSSFLIKTE